MGIELSAPGGVILEFELEGAGCPFAGGNPFQLIGTVIGVPNGANLVFAEAASTTQRTLSIGGQLAGFGTTLTLSGRANNTEAWTPLSFTTP